MKRSLLITLSLGLAGVFFAGCEWESSSDGQSWNSSYDWINFGGTYRSGSSQRALVANFSFASGGTAGTTDPEPGGDFNPIRYFQVNNEDAGILPKLSEILTGTVNYNNNLSTALSELGISSGDVESVRIAPGTFSMTFAQGTPSLASGGASDNGSGGITGTWKNYASDPTYSLTGTLDYQSGGWQIVLDDPADLGLLFDCQAYYNYQLEITLKDPEEVEDTTPDEEEETPPTQSGWIYSLQIEQTGNYLRMIDNHGSVYEGYISTVSTPGGDSTGRSSGEIVANFEVTGSSQGTPVQIVGSFRGLYTSAASTETTGTADASEPAGRLGGRTIQGTWIEPSGQGDLYGTAADIAVVAETISLQN